MSQNQSASEITHVGHQASRGYASHYFAILYGEIRNSAIRSVISNQCLYICSRCRHFKNAAFNRLGPNNHLDIGLECRTIFQFCFKHNRGRAVALCFCSDSRIGLTNLQDGGIAAFYGIIFNCLTIVVPCGSRYLGDIAHIQQCLVNCQLHNRVLWLRLWLCFLYQLPLVGNRIFIGQNNERSIRCIIAVESNVKRRACQLGLLIQNSIRTVSGIYDLPQLGIIRIVNVPEGQSCTDFRRRTGRHQNGSSRVLGLDAIVFLICIRNQTPAQCISRIVVPPQIHLCSSAGIAAVYFNSCILQGGQDSILCGRIPNRCILGLHIVNRCAACFSKRNVQRVVLSNRAGFRIDGLHRIFAIRIDVGSIGSFTEEIQ